MVHSPLSMVVLRVERLTAFSAFGCVTGAKETTIDYGPSTMDYPTFLIFPPLESRSKILVVVVGPTAVGKTAVAIKLAGEFGTEVISADSRQIFKELTIGTAKPTDNELAAVKHHFINSHSIRDDYDAAQYGRDAVALINKLFQKHDILVLCGGSGLYVKAVTEGFDDIPDIPSETRQSLNEGYEQHGLEWLQAKMQELDPDHFANVDQKNPHRLIRALEVRLATGKSIAFFQAKQKAKHPFTILKIGLELSRENLYKRIDERMDRMIADGLFEEAKVLYPHKGRQALQTVGYQEIFDYMDGKFDREEAIRLLKRNSRRYAKRQLTWFKRDTATHWFSADDIEKIIALIRSQTNLSGQLGAGNNE